MTRRSWRSCALLGSLVLLVSVVATACKPRVIGEEAAPESAATAAGSTGVASTNPPPPPPPLPVPAKLREARALIKSSPVDIERSAPLAEFTQRFARAREEQKTLPSGHAELDLLYQLVVSRGFQGAADAQEVNQKLHAWLNADATDPTPAIALARATLEAAYLARGDEYAGVVSDRRRQRFELLLRDAHDLARQALIKRSADAELYRILILTGHELGTEGSQLGEWFRAGLNTGPKYYPLHEVIGIVAAARTGQTTELARFAETMYATRNNDDGLEIYARLALAANKADQQSVVQSGFRLEPLRAGANVLHQRYPQSALLLDFLGVAAFLTEDFELGQAILPELESRPPDLKHWGEQYRYSTFREWVKGHAPPDQPDYQVWAGLSGGNSLAFVKGHHLITTPAHETPVTLSVWNLDDPRRPPEVIITPSRALLSLDTDRAGEQLLAFSTITSSALAQHYDLRQGELPATLTRSRIIKPRFPKFDRSRARPGESTFFEVSGNGKVIAAVLNGEAEVYNAHDSSLRSSFTADGLKRLPKGGRHLSYDGQLLALVNAQDVIEIWDTEQGVRLYDLSDRHLKTHYLRTLIDIQPNHQALLQVSQKTNGLAEVQLAKWNLDAETLQPLSSVERRLVAVSSLGNEYVVLASDGGDLPLVAVYRVSDGKLLRKFSGHAHALLAARLSPDAQWLATMSRTGPVKLWKIPAN